MDSHKQFDPDLHGYMLLRDLCQSIDPTLSDVHSIPKNLNLPKRKRFSKHYFLSYMVVCSFLFANKHTFTATHEPMVVQMLQNAVDWLKNNPDTEQAHADVIMSIYHTIKEDPYSSSTIRDLIDTTIRNYLEQYESWEIEEIINYHYQFGEFKKKIKKTLDDLVFSKNELAYI